MIIIAAADAEPWHSQITRHMPIVRVLQVLLLLFVAIIANAQVPIPPLTAPVIDQTNTLSAAQIASLEPVIAELERRHGKR